MSFYDPVESTFYSQCVERLVASKDLAHWLTDGIIEIGAGTAIPVVEALKRCDFTAGITGFEKDAGSFRVARETVRKSGLTNYRVVEGDFFSHAEPSSRNRARCAIGNPPYLPAAVSDMGAPELWGGEDGSTITRDVLSCGLDVVMVMAASISHPLGLLAHAHALGYAVADWAVRPIRFGRYCHDERVRNRIDALAQSGRAFCSTETYLLAGITWVRTAAPRYPEILAQVLTAAGTPSSHSTSAPARRHTVTHMARVLSRP